MKKTLTIMLMMSLAALLSGCVQMHMDTEIKKDGSGTLDMTMSLSKVVTEVIAELGDDGIDDDLSGINSMMQMDKKEFEKSLKGLDVDLKKYKSGKVDGRETVQIVLKFSDMENLSLALREITDADEKGLAILDNGDGNYVLRPHDYGWPAVEATEEDEAEEADDFEDMDPAKMQAQMASMGKLMGAMGELEISMRITVPGDIIESNAPKVEGRTSIWEMNSGNMMSGDSNMEPNIVFSSKGLKLKPVK